MTHRIYDVLAVALLAITPILAACHDAARSPTELVEPLPPPLPPPPATRNAILGREQGTSFPACIPFVSSSPSSTTLTIGYDAMEDVKFRFAISPLDVITSDTSGAGAGRVASIRFRADHYETSPRVLTSIEISMYNVGLNRLLDTREFRDLTIAIPCG